jgi:hypothetical protein
MKIRFPDEILTRILEQCMLHTCACPAQICRVLNEQRALYYYQSQCINTTENDRRIHQRITDSLEITHAHLEECLADVLQLEGWDLETYQMPEAMLQKRLSEFENLVAQDFQSIP